MTIYGRTYHLRGHSDPRYLEGLAALVDAKMREVAEATGTADTLKVAILAALNFADDYLQADRKDVSRRKTVSRDDEKRLARLVTLLDETLAG